MAIITKKGRLISSDFARVEKNDSVKTHNRENTEKIREARIRVLKELNEYTAKPGTPYKTSRRIDTLNRALLRNLITEQALGSKKEQFLLRQFGQIGKEISEMRHPKEAGRIETIMSASRRVSLLETIKKLEKEGLVSKGFYNKCRKALRPEVK